MKQQLLDSTEQKSLIVTSNSLAIEAQWPKLTLDEQRILLYALAMIKPEDEEFKTYRVSIRELTNILGQNKRKDLYRQFDLATNGLMRKIIRWTSPKTSTEDRKTKKVTWCSYAAMAEDSGYVELRFDPALKPFLLFLRSDYTAYELRAVIKLKSHYALRVYQLLKYRQGLERYGLEPVVTVDLDWFKEFLGLNPGEYNHFGHFRTKILVPAQKDIAEKTDLRFDFKPTKTGRKVTHVEFTWKINPKFDQADLFPPEVYEPAPVPDDITFWLRSIGFYDAERIREAYGDEALTLAKSDLEFSAQKAKDAGKPISNPGGWIRARLPVAGEPYTPTSVYLEHIEATEAEAKRKEKSSDEARQRAYERAKFKAEKARERLIDEAIENLTLAERQYLETEAEARLTDNDRENIFGLKFIYREKLRDVYVEEYGDV